MNIVKSTKRNLIGKANSFIFVAAIVGSVSLSIAVVSGKILLDQHSFNLRVMKEKRTARNNLSHNIKQLSTLKNNLVSLDGTPYNSKVILEALPSKYDFPAVGSSIEFIAKNSGQDMTKFKFGGNDLGDTPLSKSPLPTPVPIPFSAAVAGSADKVFTFLSDTERSIRPISVRTLELKGSDGSNVLLDISADTYYQPTKDLRISTKEIK